MSSKEQIKGRIKFYDKTKGFGYIATKDKDYFFNSSDLSENYIPNSGDLVSFVSADENGKKARANIVQPYAKSSKSSSNKTEKHSSPPCPHCGSTKGSKYGWTDGNGCKHNVCLSCGEEHTYGAIKTINDEVEKEIERKI